MNRLSLCFGIAALLAPSAASAQDAAPDMRGAWVGTSQSIVLGKAKHHVPNAKDQPLLDNVEFTFIIDRQDGHRFWGTLVSPRHRERLIGVVGLDGKTIVARTSEGEVRGTLIEADTIQHVYSAGGPSNVVAVNLMKRRRQ